MKTLGIRDDGRVPLVEVGLRNPSACALVACVHAHGRHIEVARRRQLPSCARGIGTVEQVSDDESLLGQVVHPKPRVVRLELCGLRQQSEALLALACVDQLHPFGVITVPSATRQ